MDDRGFGARENAEILPLAIDLAVTSHVDTVRQERSVAQEP
jgi:hypothetical protein